MSISKHSAQRQRQQCINLLEKITKNLFRMLRRPETTDKELISRFLKLYGYLSRYREVILSSDYHRQMWRYVDEFSKEIQQSSNVIDRQHHMTALNRLQKLKNQKQYKRNKRLEY